MRLSVARALLALTAALASVAAAPVGETDLVPERAVNATALASLEERATIATPPGYVALQRGYAWAADSRWVRTVLDAKAMPTWYWHWQGGPIKEFGGSGVAWIPCYWGPRRQSYWKDREADMARGGLPTHILAQNEIDVSTQANQNAQDAATSWISALGKYQKQGVKISSPQIVWNINLLKETVGVLNSRGYDVDFIAVHSYRPWWDVEGFQKYIQRVHAAFPSKPIWVTEIGVTAASGGSVEQTKSYHVQVMNWLQKQPYVARACIYGVFAQDDPPDSFASSNNAIFTSDGKLNSLGWWYARSKWGS